MRRANALISIAAGLALMFFTATPALADPPGFNGTVKIHEEPGEAEPIKRNEPHVCVFHVHGFNFDANARGWYRIDAWAPTAGNMGRGQTSWGPASGAGEWKSGAITLSPGHYKLFFDQTAPEAPGAEKHKVFWVECESQGGAGGSAGGSSNAGGNGNASGNANGNAGGNGNGNAGGNGNGNAGGNAGGSDGGNAGGNVGGSAGGNVGGSAGGSASGSAGGSAGVSQGVVAGVQSSPSAPTGAAPLLAAVAGVQTLPSTSTEPSSGLLGLGVAFILIGGLLIRRKPITF